MPLTLINTEVGSACSSSVKIVVLHNTSTGYYCAHMTVCNIYKACSTGEIIQSSEASVISLLKWNGLSFFYTTCTLNQLALISIATSRSARRAPRVAKVRGLETHLMISI